MQRGYLDLGNWQFFVGGTSEKCGTTWMQIMLDAHSNIMCKGETDFIWLLPKLADFMTLKYAHTLKANNKEHHSMYFPTEEVLLKAWSVIVDGAMKQHLTEDVRFIGDKTPAYGDKLDVMLEWLPNAKFIILRRNTKDVVVSQIRGKTTGNENVTPMHMARMVKGMYDRRNNLLIKAQESMPNRVLAVDYEDLVEDCRSKMSEVLTFLTGNNEHVDTVIEAGSFKKLSGGRNNGEEDVNSFFRKGIVGDWKNHLTSDVIEYLEREESNAGRREDRVSA
jgi:hypothetical protein